MSAYDSKSPPTKPADQERWEGLLRGQVINATTAKFASAIHLADQKAQVLIFLNSILIPVALNWIDKPLFHTAALISIVTALCSILAAIICIYPKRKAGRKADGTLNLLHFNDIGHMPRKEFLEDFLPIFNNPGKLAEIAVNDLYDTAQNAMIPKFFWLKVAYAIFFLGNLAAVIWSVSSFWGVSA